MNESKSKLKISEWIILIHGVKQIDFALIFMNNFVKSNLLKFQKNFNLEESSCRKTQFMETFVYYIYLFDCIVYPHKILKKNISQAKAKMDHQHMSCLPLYIPSTNCWIMLDYSCKWILKFFLSFLHILLSQFIKNSSSNYFWFYINM